MNSFRILNPSYFPVQSSWVRQYLAVIEISVLLYSPILFQCYLFSTKQQLHYHYQLAIMKNVQQPTTIYFGLIINKLSKAYPAQYLLLQNRKTRSNIKASYPTIQTLETSRILGVCFPLSFLQVPTNPSPKFDIRLAPCMWNSYSPGIYSYFQQLCGDGYIMVYSRSLVSINPSQIPNQNWTILDSTGLANNSNSRRY